MTDQPKSISFKFQHDPNGYNLARWLTDVIYSRDFSFDLKEGGAWNLGRQNDYILYQNEEGVYTLSCRGWVPPGMAELLVWKWGAEMVK